MLLIYYIAVFDSLPVHPCRSILDERAQTTYLQTRPSLFVLELL